MHLIGPLILTAFVENYAVVFTVLVECHPWLTPKLQLVFTMLFSIPTFATAPTFGVIVLTPLRFSGFKKNGAQNC